MLSIYKVMVLRIEIQSNMTTVSLLYFVKHRKKHKKNNK